MSLPRTNLVAAYLGLVGVPLLALVGILEAGRNLRAPAAISGQWEISGDTQPPVPCAPRALMRPVILAIAQSGQYLSLTLEHLQGFGKLDHDLVILSELRPDGSSPCTMTAELQARLETPAAMAGVLRVGNCARCPSIPFRASRRLASAKGKP